MIKSLRTLRNVGLLTIILNCLFISPALAEHRWIDSETHDNVVYLLSEHPAELARYDLQNASFLPAISLSSGFDKARALHVDDDGIFVVVEQQIFTVDTETSSTSFLANIDGDVWGLGAIGDNLYAATTIGDQNNSLREHIYRYQKSTGIYQQNQQYFIRRDSWFVSPENQAILGVQPGQRPYRLEIEDSGAFGEFTIIDFPHSFGFNDINLFPLENESRILYSNGLVADAATGEFSNVIPDNGDILDLVEYGDELFVLRSDRIERLDSNFLRTGVFAVDGDPLFDLSIFDTGANGTSLFAFGVDLSLEVQELFPVSISVSAIGSAPLDPALDPDTDFINISQLVAASNGDAFILDEFKQSILEWSETDQAYINVITLIDKPDHITWRPGTRELYVSYEEGFITRVDLDTGIETGFFNSTDSIGEIFATEEFLVISDGQFFQRQISLLDFDGEVVAEMEFNHSVSNFVWSDVHRLLYLHNSTFSAENILALPINEQLEIGATITSESFSFFQRLNAPLKLSPDDSVLLDGSGVILNAETLEVITFLTERVADAAWTADGQLLTITDNRPYRLQQWGANYELLREYELGFFNNTPYLLGSNEISLFTNNGVGTTQSIVLSPDGDDIDGDGITDAVDTDPALVSIELGDGSCHHRVR